MRKFHISSFSGRSGISHYAKDFFDFILSPRGYEQLDPELCASSAIEEVELDDMVHIEIGVNEVSAIQALYQLIDRGHRNVTVTLHDPPFISWPYFRFRSWPLNLLSKFIHLYLHNFGIGDGYFKKIGKIFVLTHAGAMKTRSRYRLSNVFHLPFLVNPGALCTSALAATQNLVFFGFIAKNKGLDYALELHERLLEFFPECKFFVVGDAMGGDSAAYLSNLKSRYTSNVEYLGFVDDAGLKNVFEQATIAVMPFAAYRSIIPASASILNAMAAGKVVCATSVNAISEFIQDGVTGVILRRNIESDVEQIRALLATDGAVNKLANNAVEFLRLNHGPVSVGDVFDHAIETRCGI